MIEVIEVLLVVVGTVLVVGLGVIGLLRLLGIEVYPAPSFPCVDCDKVKMTQLGLTCGVYECQVCRDEVSGEYLSCITARGSRDCWKNARKANHEQQD